MYSLIDTFGICMWEGEAAESVREVDADPCDLRQLADSRSAARHCSMTFMQASPSANEGAIG